jgi:hypothetical protein
MTPFNGECEDCDSLPSIYWEVRREQQKTEVRFGEQNHSPADWMLVVGEEFGEAQKELVEILLFPSESNRRRRLHNYRAELIQLANVVVKAIESYDRNEGKQ